MPRDYKHRANRRKKRARLSPLVGVLAGLLIGLFVAFLIYIKMQAKPGEPVYIQETLPPATDISQEDASEGRPDEAEASPPPPKPRFDFYTLLPEMEVVIPEEEIVENREQQAPPVATPAVAAPATETAPVQTTPATQAKPAITTEPVSPPKSGGSYYLQVGSFRNGVQAERFRAELAMMGMQTNIQQVTINNTDTYHRVRVGPFGSLDDLDRARQTLKKNGIDSTPIKVRG